MRKAPASVEHCVDAQVGKCPMRTILTSVHCRAMPKDTMLPFSTLGNDPSIALINLSDSEY